MSSELTPSPRGQAARVASTKLPDGLRKFADRHGLADWEARFSPYEEQVYDAVLREIDSQDVVLDLGAGDLRLALRLAQRARRVYAIEVNPVLLGQSLANVGLALPRSLHVICANALDVRIPGDVSVAVLLMRHCRHTVSYISRLERVGCRKLVTNARWGMGVETIDLMQPGMAFEQVHEGWYACRCGSIGYVGCGRRPLDAPFEVAYCPTCTGEEQELERE